MRVIYIIFLLFSFIFTTTHLVPEEYSTIQAGIDAAVDGDTVLVNQGLYYENIHLTKSIVLTSYAIYDDLENWTEYSTIFSEWQITYDNINNTIIVGSTATDDYGSCILIYSPFDDDCITPEVIGFTIKNGLGTMVDRGGEQQRIGAGILFDISDPTISFNQIEDNGSTEVFSGGGTYGTSMEEDWSFNNRDLNGRTRCEVDTFNLENNLYDGNDALYGNTFANVDFEESIAMSGSVFDVANCQQEEVSAVWVYVEPVAEVELEDIAANQCAITGNSAYVNPNIAQECIEDGCGTSADNPFKTITWALEMIMPSETNQTTIYLANGTYSQETGETFPIILSSYVNLQGENDELTILDAMGISNVIIIDNCIQNTISNLTITNGEASDNEHGGGIMVFGSLYTKLVELNILHNNGGVSALFNNAHTSIFKCRFEDNYSSQQYYYSPALACSGCKVFRSTFNNNAHALQVSDSYISKILIHDHNSHSNTVLISSSIVNNVTIVNNEDTWDPDPDQSPIYLGRSKIENSILWSNIPSTITVPWTSSSDTLYINYSDIEGGEESIWITDPDFEFTGYIDWGENNINNNPQFTNANYNLNLFTSPCINAGNPNPWYNDTNSSRNDMGYTGGPDYYIDFTEYDFEQVGVNSISIKNWNITNFGDEPLVIEEVLNQNANFSIIDTQFPIVIEPFSEQSIKLMFSPQSSGEHQANFNFISNQISEDATLLLSGTGHSSTGNTLTGDLYGTISVEGSPYRIINNINVDNNDVLTIEPGVRFEFEGQYKFEINGILEAVGTESDSIVFTTLSPDTPDSLRWLGIEMNNQTDATVLDYVKIERTSGGVFNGNCDGCYDALDGGALRLYDSNPILNNMIIDCYIEYNPIQLEPSASKGGGIYLASSSPIISNSIIKNCLASNGGGIYIGNSQPTLENIIIENNVTGGNGGGIYISGSINTNGESVYILNNRAGQSGGGIYTLGSNISNFYIIGNYSQIGGGVYAYGSGFTISNSVISDNYVIHSSGSAIYSHQASTSSYAEDIEKTLILSNVVITGNEADNPFSSEIPKSSIVIDGYDNPYTNEYHGNIIFINSIFWNNEDPIILRDGDGVLVSTHSLIEGGTDNIVDQFLNSESITDQIIWLDGNIDVNPQFNLGLEDFTLQESSPCIDAGTAYFEYENQVLLELEDDEYYGLAPDMGAHELFIYQSGDINQDSVLNILDIVAIVNLIMANSEYNALADLNGDNIINILDVILLVNTILDL